MQSMKTVAERKNTYSMGTWSGDLNSTVSPSLPGVVLLSNS